MMITRKTSVGRWLFAAALCLPFASIAVAQTAAPSKLNCSGGYAIHATAARGAIKVGGSGKFELKDDGKELVFVSAIGKGKPFLDMGERQEHTKKNFELTPSSVLTLTVPRSQLTFPEPGKKTTGTATGKLKFAAGEQPVRIKYTARAEGGGFVVESAEFQFNHPLHRTKKEPICLAMICVSDLVTVQASNLKINAQ